MPVHVEGGEPTEPEKRLPVVRGTYESRALGRTQSYAYIAPPGFDSEQAREGTRRYPLLILLHGLTGNHLTWLTQTRLAQYAAEYDLFIACPEGAEGWYTNALETEATKDAKRETKLVGRYEDDLMLDFLPHLEATLPLLPAGRHRAIGGMSMGGYGAIKIALTYGRLFSLALSHSGAFEYPQRQPAHPIFGDPERDLAVRRATNIFKLAEDALSTWPPARPNLYFDCGLNDRWLEANQRFHQHLDYIGYRHTYVEQPGFHTLPYWDQAIRQALPVIWEAVREG